MIDKKDILFVRNYIHEELLNKTMIDFENTLNIKGNNFFYGIRLLEALFFKEASIQYKFKYVVLIDEDCMVFDKEMIFDIIEYMENHGFDIYGCPDGGYNMRSHRDDVPNLFFTIFKCEKLKNVNFENYKNYKIPTLWVSGKERVSYDEYEPYYKPLCYFVNDLGMKFMPAKYYEYEDKSFVLNIDDITKIYPTYVKWKNKDLCVHTWYARKYGVNPNITKYIDTFLVKI